MFARSWSFRRASGRQWRSSFAPLAHEPRQTGALRAQVLVFRLGLDPLEPQHVAVAPAGLATDVVEAGKLLLEIGHQHRHLFLALTRLARQDPHLTQGGLVVALAFVPHEAPPPVRRALLGGPLEQEAKVDPDRDDAEECRLV